MTDGEVYKIPSANLPALQEQVKKLGERNKANGGSGISIMPVGGFVGDNNVQFTEVMIVAGTNVIDQYEFIATLDHSQETGTIVRGMPNKSVPEQYRNCEPDCDHCNLRRKRRDTYVLRHTETGEYVQVGSSCMSEMFDTDPRDACKRAETLAFTAEALARASKSTKELTNPQPLRDMRHLALDEYLAFVARRVRSGGFISAKEAWESAGSGSPRIATRDAAYSDMFTYLDAHQPTDEDRELAEAAKQWAISLGEKDTMSDYENNVSVVARSMFIEGRAAGLAASIVGVYVKNQNRNKPAVNVGNMEGVIALLKRGGERLKNPKITIDFPSFGTVVLNLAKDHHKVPGSVNVVSTGGYGNNTFYGRVMPDGTFKGTRFASPALETGLRQLATSPAETAAAHGHHTGQCCFCNRKLTDDNSTAVGYGPVCAENYNLPYGAAATAEALAE